MNHSPRYEIRHTDAGHHVAFIAGNGEVVVVGEPLRSRRNAVKAIESVAGPVWRDRTRFPLPWDLAVVHVGRGLIEVRDVDMRHQPGDTQ